MGAREFRAGYALILLVVMAVAVGLWALLRPAVKPEPDMVRVMELNNEGVGWMEQFKYKEAAEVFAKVRKLAPDWLPGEINEGIALLNWRQYGTDGKKSADEVAMEGMGEPQPIDKAFAIFGRILKKDANNLHANFCRGLALLNMETPPEDADPYFKRVTEIDPEDAHAWYWLAEAGRDSASDRLTYAERAVKLNPYIAGAHYRLEELANKTGDFEKAAAAKKRMDGLMEARQSDIATFAYTQQGKYAEVLGRVRTGPQIATGPVPFFTDSSQFKVTLAPGTRWTISSDFGSGDVAELRRSVRQRFGGTIVVLDYDLDGRPDLFLLGAVVEDGQVRDLLLHNEGEGKFRDVTKEMGLASPWPSLGCCVGDFNNDGYPDLIITGAGQQKLFANVAGPDGKRRFKDETKKAGLDSVKTVCLGAMWIDLDQDSDLDLILCQYADTPAAALSVLKKGGSPGPGLAVFLNVGEALPQHSKKKEPLPPELDDKLPLQPLTTAFRRLDKAPGLVGTAASAVAVAASDLDRDHDLDLVLLADQQEPSLILNDRLLKFHTTKLPDGLATPARWNGGLVFNSRHNERSDLFLLRQGQRPLVLINQPGCNEKKGDWFKEGITNSPPLIAAQAIDLDLDGWTDIVGLSEDRQPVFLHNDGHRLVHVDGLFGLKSTLPKDLIGVVALDILGHCAPDVLLWSEKDGLQLRHNLGNGNHGVYLDLTGVRTDKAKRELRTNADGFGAWVVAQAGNLWTGGELSTLSAGLGQSRQPLLLGLGKHPTADVVRLHWPDQIRQAELGIRTCQIETIWQINRMSDSCPLLFTWNGERFTFISDILGAGAMGEAGSDGGFRPPRPEESLNLGSHQLAAKDGKFHIKVAEVRDEIAYMDQYELVVIDHPAGLNVIADERFAGSGPAPSQDLLVFDQQQQYYPIRAVDHQGKDVTEKLKAWDRDAVDDFAIRAWLGYAEDHWIELDFGAELAQFQPQDKLYLRLAGWTNYPYPESIWAAEQAGVPLQVPELQRQGKDGKWETVLADMGFPAGLPRLITVDVTGKLTGPTCKLRIRSNMQVYWDQIYIAPLQERIPAPRTDAPATKAKLIKTQTLAVSEATLKHRGFVQEISPDGKQPLLYDYDRLEPAAVPHFTGNLTRYGDVTELLHKSDDQFVIMGPGDELTMLFDAQHLPPVPKGWQRSFVLQACGYSRSASLFIAEGGTVEPLPFHAMKNFPYGPGEHYPQTPAHVNYQKKYNTRKLGAATP